MPRDMIPSMVDNEYVLTKDWPSEHERLALLEAMVDELSIAAIRAAGFAPGARCLDVGAGSGSIARWFAREARDPSSVVATDVDTRLLVPLEAEGVQVMVHDVVVDELPPKSFDVIHCRSVLEHLVARDEIVRRMAEWLTPDGVLVLVDCASFPVASSHHVAYRDAMQAWVDVLALTGTDYDWSRTFPEPLLRHGYRDVGAMLAAPVLRGGSPTARFWQLTLESLRSRIVAADLSTDGAIDEALRLLGDPELWDLAPAFVATWGRRPR
jgi:SAM-dependent methyltransferase